MTIVQVTRLSRWRWFETTSTTVQSSWRRLDFEKAFVRIVGIRMWQEHQIYFSFGRYSVRNLAVVHLAIHLLSAFIRSASQSPTPISTVTHTHSYCHTHSHCRSFPLSFSLPKSLASIDSPSLSPTPTVTLAGSLCLTPIHSCNSFPLSLSPSLPPIVTLLVTSTVALSCLQLSLWITFTPSVPLSRSLLSSSHFHCHSLFINLIQSSTSKYCPCA
jgi:hypothetical protein